jgi:hypothetical protein
MGATEDDRLDRDLVEQASAVRLQYAHRAMRAALEADGNRWEPTWLPPI